MKNVSLLEDLPKVFQEKRRNNLNIILYLAIIAKIKLKTSSTDIAFAITDTELLSELYL